jgi:hypothetical protein
MSNNFEYEPNKYLYCIPQASTQTCPVTRPTSAGLRYVGARYRVRFEAPVSKFSATGGRGWRLTLPETIKCGVFEDNSCNIWLESGPLYTPGPVQLYPLYPP